jgi:hypothetical protein
MRLGPIWIRSGLSWPERCGWGWGWGGWGGWVLALVTNCSTTDRRTIGEGARSQSATERNDRLRPKPVCHAPITTMSARFTRGVQLEPWPRTAYSPTLVFTRIARKGSLGWPSTRRVQAKSSNRSGKIPLLGATPKRFRMDEYREPTCTSGRIGRSEALRRRAQQWDFPRTI